MPLELNRRRLNVGSAREKMGVFTGQQRRARAQLETASVTGAWNAKATGLPVRKTASRLDHLKVLCRH